MVVGPAGLQDSRQRDRDRVRVSEREDRDRQFAVKRTRTESCNYEPSWEHLTFELLTKKMGKFDIQFSLSASGNGETML